MTKTEFYDLVDNMIIPLFTGSYVAGEIESSPRDLEVALGKCNSILLKPSKTDEYRVIIKRGQAFKVSEVNLIKIILKEIDEISKFEIHDETYYRKLCNLAIEKALIESITETSSSTVLGIIHVLEKWANRTYEGQTVDLGVLVNLSATSDDAYKVYYNDVLSKDFSALFTDGINSFIEFDSKGVMLGYVCAKQTKNAATISPYKFEKAARICNDKKVGIILTQKGDILIFYEHQLVFAKRNGNWCVYSHDEIIRLLQNNVSYAAKQIRKSIYTTALDCSFAYNGACIVYINKDNTLEALNHIDPGDIISESHFIMKKGLELEEAGKLYNLGNAQNIIEKFSVGYDEFLSINKCVKSMTLRKIVAGKKLFELDRKFIEEMTSVDGATIVDYDGTIIAVGAIVKIGAGSQGGGRLAATQTMAKYGVAIKVSQDGIMAGYTYDKKKNAVKQIFYVGWFLYWYVIWLTSSDSQMVAVCPWEAQRGKSEHQKEMVPANDWWRRL